MSFIAIAHNSTHVVAIVIAFHPEVAVDGNLAALRPQTDALIVVDNGSTPEELVALREAAARLGFELIENDSNLGVATALNIGIRHAIALGAEWILLFDQDSQVTPNFTATMLQGFATSTWGDRLGLLVPRYTDMRYGNDLATERLPDGTLATTITSGSLLRTATLLQHGLFLDELFIDAVDHEYSLRLRRAGLVLAECPAAVLLHSPGTPQQYFLGRRLLFEAPNYSPLRRYYQQRNRIAILRRYLRDFPGYCLRLVVASVKDLVKILCFEPHKFAKLSAYCSGLRDGVLGRMGRRSPRK